MKRLGLFVISVLLVLGAFIVTPPAYAALSQDDLTRLQNFGSIFRDINPTFGTRWDGMTQNVYNRFKDDPDVDATQFRKYVLQGIPGATIPDQTGFIPMLNGVINGGGSSDTVSRAQLALVQANQLLSNAQTNEQLAAGEISRAEADQQRANAAQTGASQSGQVLNQRAEKNEPCSLNPLKFDLPSCLDSGITWIIKNTFLQLAGFLVWLCANMLNYAIQISILGFSKWAPDTLYVLWIIVRQIVSLVVVFAGLYLGFMYIIGREDTFGKYIGWLCIFALFVNFSYPVTRALTDISNIVSLNIYQSAVGSEALTTDFTSAATTLGANTAGSLIMTRLGLQGLVGAATNIKTGQASVVDQITTTPGALIAVAFVAYAAYIFFMATAIIASRTAILVFLIVASPLLLVDSIVPKLGDAAMKMRKMFFEQLVVAPVFMIMLALTLKFMEVFQEGGPLRPTSTSALAGGAGSITTFFSILMMLIMLHIMLKVTKHVAGEAGNYATNLMGKVGGFGLAAASAGTGLLARGTIGQLAAGARDSQWMDGMKSSKFGRGLYGLSNSLAQSTFDSRNIGMVSRGMASVGLTGGLGMTMQQGGKRGFEEEQKAREEKVLKFGSNIRDDATRGSYFDRANKGFVYSKVSETKMKQTEREIQDKRAAALAAFTAADGKQREALMSGASGDYVLQDKMRTANQYLAVDSKNDPNAVTKKVDLLKKLNDSDLAKKVIDTDPFADIEQAYKEDIKKREEDLETKSRENKMVIDGVEQKVTEYEYYRQQIAQKKQEMRQEIEGKRKELTEAYKNEMNEITGGPVDVELPDESPTTTTNGSMPRTQSAPANIPATAKGPDTTVGSQTKGMSQERETEAQTPAYLRAGGGDPFSSSFAESRRKSRGGEAGSANTQAPQAPNTPSPRGEAATA